MLQVVLAFLEDPKCRMNKWLYSNDGFWLCQTKGNLLDYTFTNSPKPAGRKNRRKHLVMEWRLGGLTSCHHRQNRFALENII